MISTFYKGTKLVGQAANLPGYVPIGATIPSGFVSTDPANPKNKLLVTAMHLDLATGDARYTVAPMPGA